MKKLLYIFAAAAALSAVSCVKENFDGAQEGATTFYGKALDVKTQVLDGHTVWSANDNIKVFYNNTNVVAELKMGENTSSATFEASVGAATDYYAVYPASETASMTDGTMTVTLPATQNGLFGAGHIAVAKAADKTFTFTNVNAFLKMTFASAQYTRIVVESVAGQALAGDLSITFAGGVPAVAATYANTSSSVEVTSETPFAAGDIYISVLPGVTHTQGLLVTCYNGEQLKGTYYVDKSVATEASVTLTFDVFEPNGNYYVTAEGSGNQNGLSLTNAMSAAKAVELIRKSATDQAALKAIDGAVFNFAAGEYVLADEALALSYDAAEPVKLTFKGEEGTVFSGNEAHSIMTISGADVSMEGITITKSVATETKTGAIKVSGENSKLTLSKCTVRDNVVSGEEIVCAGIVLDGADFVADGTKFINNDAYSSCVLYVNDATLTLTDCEFKGNDATAKVGVVLLEGEQISSFTNCDFVDNHAWEYGIIQHVAGNTTFTDCDFKENGVNESKYPGVFQLDEGGSGKLTVIGGLCSGNTAGSCGVVNQEATGALLEMTDVVMQGNYGKDGHAAFWSAGKATFTRCTFKANTSGSTAKTAGQSITISNGADVEMYGCVIQDHATTSSSTAVSVKGDSKLTMSADNQGNKNVVSNNSAGYGGAFALVANENTSPVVEISDTDFIGNHAKGCGVLRVQGSTDLSLDNCFFKENYSTEAHSGAIGWESSGELVCNNCTFEGNYALPKDGNSNGYGGVAALEGDGKMYINGCHFEGNHAYKQGAVIRAYEDPNKMSSLQSRLYLNACTFTGNYITGHNYGSTIFVDVVGEFAMNNCTIADDTYGAGDNSNERECWMNFNVLDKFLMSNNTLVGSPRRDLNTPVPGGLVRAWLDKDTDAHMINNIIVADPGEKIYALLEVHKTEFAPSFTLHHTKYSSFQEWDSCSKYVTHKESPVSSGFTRDSFGGLTWNADGCYWSWNGTMTGGGNNDKITKSEYVSALEDANPAFKTWLEEINALDKDQLGNSRGTGEWWPGSYQKN